MANQLLRVADGFVEIAGGTQGERSFDEVGLIEDREHDNFAGRNRRRIFLKFSEDGDAVKFWHDDIEEN